MVLTDDSIMPFGKYAKTETRMEDVPASYLLWLWEKQGTTKPFGEAAEAVQAYIRDNLDCLKKEEADIIKRKSYDD